MGRKVRLEFIADLGAKRGQTFSGVVVEPEYDAIMTTLLNKLKMKRKPEMLLVLRDKHQGPQLLSPEKDLRCILRDGSTVVLTTQRPAARMPPPPRWPWPTVATTDPEAAAEGAESAGESAPAVASAAGNAGQCHHGGAVAAVGAGPVDREHCGCPAPSGSTEASVSTAVVGALEADDGGGVGQNQPWPRLEGNVLPLLRRAIAGEGNFVEKDCGGYLAFDYSAPNAGLLPDMFPDPRPLPRKSDARLLAAVRRECRGLLVSSRSGEVLARRLPKFFNADEIEETRLDLLPTSGGSATTKLDGSLVSPFLLEDEVRWAGRSAIVPVVESFVAAAGGTGLLAEKLLRQGFTPIFEWCGAGPPVGVVVHQASRLVLIAVRDNVSGAFWPIDRVQALGCDCVEVVAFESLRELLTETQGSLNQEGVVVAWPEHGLLVKLKSAWWLALAAAQKRGVGQPGLILAKALQSVPLSGVPPSLLWLAALGDDDDQMASAYGQLAPAGQGALRKFSANVESGIKTLEGELTDWAHCASDATELDVSRVAGGWPPQLLAAYLRRSPTAGRELRKFLAKLATSGHIHAVEALTGTSWDGGRQPQEVCGHLGKFQRAPSDLVSHVLSTYLPRKFEEYFGSAVTGETPILLERLYDASEGKIKGFWEEFVDVGIIDLRVDLQPRAKIYGFHNGDADFAHWQVQFGPNDHCPRSTKARDGDRKGAFAGVLVRTGTEVDFAQVRDAMSLSFETQRVVKLDPKPSSIFQVYLDLDGVLVDFEAGFQKDFGCLPEPKLRWQHIENTPGFYEDLPWMQDGRRLWDHISHSGLPLFVLTGIPEGALGDRSADEKRRWVARELGPDVNVITCLTREKPQYSGPGRLLIDDRAQAGWEAAGGRQLRHAAVDETLAGLVELGLGRRFSAVSEEVQVLSSLHEDLRAAACRAEAVALDVEWRPDRAGAAPNPAELLQLAFRPSGRWAAFVLDVRAWDEELQAFVRDLLAGDLPKLVFGSGDANRLGLRIVNGVDLQDGAESLASRVRKAGLLLQKTKAIQACDWSARPLRDEQIAYAATDALVLLELSGGRAARQSRTLQEVGRSARVEFTGIFLTPDARKKLLRRLPPQFCEVVADHMTLAWKPESVKCLAVGSSIKLQIDGVACQDGVQAAATATLEAQPRRGHVTISHRTEVPAAEANGLDEFESVEPFVVEGVLGAMVALSGGDGSQLPASIMQKLRALAKGQPGQSEKFEGLSDSQRYALHLVADELGLEHRSEGKKGTSHRKLIVMHPRGKKARKQLSETRAQSVERVVVRDPRKFAALFGETPGLALHACMTQEGLQWEPGVNVPLALSRALSTSVNGGEGPLDLVVIMRGFPGSGKSSLAAQLCSTGGMDVLSADDFFVAAGGIRGAHEQCREAFVRALAARRSAVVDNTNVRRSDYAFYRAKAEERGYTIVVLEFVCEGTKTLERLRERSTHNVPGGAVGEMWSKWEQEPAALRIAPYLPLTLLHWIREQNLLNRPPNTHMVMSSGSFFSVPLALRAEFYERFSREWGSHCISEQGRPQAFRLFFDTDGMHLSRLLPALEALWELVGVELVVTGTEEAPAPGFHIFVPSRTVDSATAAALREHWLQRRPELAQYVDGQLYKVPQLRLLGSRKISKEGVDLGRVHQVLGRFDGQWDTGGPWEWPDVSIIV